MELDTLHGRLLRFLPNPPQPHDHAANPALLVNFIRPRRNLPPILTLVQRRHGVGQHHQRVIPRRGERVGQACVDALAIVLNRVHFLSSAV